ncbi:hypothetical protein KIL84_009273 [Mauremys mutica]|uniref:Uncharacterized protein n=1 Tax=Mauremys mutica TaxID=74926 RepID=A0A9D3XIS9_9SAUR|nr:hypothetical protein KIL84_009273 [Mauremys mutica]
MVWWESLPVKLYLQGSRMKSPKFLTVSQFSNFSSGNSELLLRGRLFREKKMISPERGSCCVCFAGLIWAPCKAIQAPQTKILNVNSSSIPAPTLSQIVLPDLLGWGQGMYQEWYIPVCV